MARNENPPFCRGETFYNGETIDTANLGGLNLEGAEWVFEDVHPSTGVKRTNRPVRCRIVRNTAAIALEGKRLASFEAGALEYGSRIDGYALNSAADTPNEGYVIDEYLPSGGVAVNDLCWIVIEGPSAVLTTVAALPSVFSIGQWAVAATGVTSGATTAGRIIPQVFSSTAGTLAAQVQNRVGRALSAATTANTNSSVVLDIGKW